MANNTLQKLIDAAIDFIQIREEEDDFICEQMPPEYCETHCIDTLRKECVKEFLTNYYEIQKK